MRVLMIFVDGIGLGRSDESNPFYQFDTPGICSVLGGKNLVSSAAGFYSRKASLQGIDATLGVPGTPQSATGQTTIFTGENAPALIGGHVNGYPGKTLRQLLAKKGLFKRFMEQGFKACFANAYRPVFFEFLPQRLPGYHYSCSTLVTYYAGLPFYSLDDLKAGHALYMDITGEILHNMGFDAPLLTPEEGANRLLAISRDFDFCLFEYFLSDLAGHLGKKEEAQKVVSVLDRFLGELAEKLDAEETFVMLISDHGNLEDMTTRDHTLNTVPVLTFGPPGLRDLPVMNIRDLTAILPAVEVALRF